VYCKILYNVGHFASCSIKLVMSQDLAFLLLFNFRLFATTNEVCLKPMSDVPSHKLVMHITNYPLFVCSRIDFSMACDLINSGEWNVSAISM
jgi:hypothetical protein